LLSPGSVSIDGSGLDSQYISPYFLRRTGRHMSPFVKIEIVAHNKSHLILAFCAGPPCHDAKHAKPLIQHAASLDLCTAMFGDGAFDSEDFHRECRRAGIPQSIAPINPRAHNLAPSTPHRKKMFSHFPKKPFGQRWQVESTFSQIKRLLGSSLRARGDQSRYREASLKILTFNLMIHHELFSTEQV